MTQLAMTIAAGGRCVSDLRTLRDQPGLFGPVASDATGWRAVHQVDRVLFDELVAVRQAATRRLLAQADPEQIELEVDATLLHLHSEDKQGAGPTFKGGFGFAPMLCFIEPLGCRRGCCGRAGRPRTTPGISWPRSIRPSAACPTTGEPATGPATTPTRCDVG